MFTFLSVIIWKKHKKTVKISLSKQITKLFSIWKNPNVSEMEKGAGGDLINSSALIGK